jgi:hypothetical protein
MPRFIAAFALATLAACGADGPPEPPASKAVSGASVSGCVQMGVVSGKVDSGGPDC